MKTPDMGPSWWIVVPRDQFYTEAIKRSAAMTNKDFAWTLKRKPKPEGNRASVQTEAA